MRLGHGLRSVTAAWALISGLACGPDQETLRRQEAEKQIAASHDAAADRLEADAAKLDDEVARSKATSAMYERKAWAKLRRDGTFGPRTALGLRARAAEGSEIESIIVGRMIDEFSQPLAVPMNEATDDARAIEPFAVKADHHRVKAAIKAMSRLEHIGEIEVGFAEFQIPSTSETDVDVWGYLVAWYHHDAAVGFVYQSRLKLELDAVVTETSRFVEMMSAELPKPKAHSE